MILSVLYVRMCYVSLIVLPPVVIVFVMCNINK